MLKLIPHQIHEQNCECFLFEIYECHVFEQTQCYNYWETNFANNKNP